MPSAPANSTSPGASSTANDGIDQPCFALADHARILMPDLAAFRLGVRPGSTRSHAFALAPRLTLLAVDIREEQNALEAVALALLAFTPKVVLAHANTVLLEVGASMRLFGGLRALLSRVTSTVKGCGFTSRMGCAPTAWGAWLLAHARTRRVARRVRVVKETTLVHVLDALPVSLIPSAHSHGNVFEQIGCATLADLRRLPRKGVARRFGQGVLQWLAQAYGQAPDPREAFCAPASFEARLELQARVESADALLFAARRLVLQLAGWLSAHHAAVSEFSLLLEHELAARHAPKTSTFKVAWAVPTREADHILWLLREKLNQTTLAAPVIEMKLVADKVSEHAPPAETLFPMPGSDSESLAQLLERLSARLGAENVVQLVARDDHRPEAAMTVEAYKPASETKPKRAKKSLKTQEAKADAPTEAQAESDGPLELPDLAVPSQPRPSWILETPQKLLLRNERPFYRRPLKLISRTERIEAGWWDGNGVQRDYYVAADDRGRMFWLYRERLTGDWFLHGFFG
ncbi:nucleotidyltransferase/DNA polymerase [Caballeronia novacaledonica]|uniref:Nucleotidyltransferase/DNA polymerase n=1 Tax=Caballeronia novacaledonica TaxID=1544861 RepID=A0A2U3IFI6_9BURK|nr:DNA polymerase Y family protein [Caballeronia novacaledonica]SPB18986.1 nucleotidyltransferase/DNA polymerase [Caballeronia novacaledonica]